MRPVFWLAESRERVLSGGASGFEVAVWVSDGPDRRVPDPDRLVSWVLVHGPDPRPAVFAALDMAELSAGEVTARSDGLFGVSWWRGVARRA